MPPAKSKKTTPARELLIRTASVLVLLPIVVFAVMKGGIYYKGLLVVVTLLMGYEYARLTQLDNKTKAVFIAGLVATVWWLLAAVPAEGFIDGMIMAIIAAATAVGIGVILKKHRMCWAGFGIVYVAIPMFGLAYLGRLDDGVSWILWMLALVWASDIGAYVFGRTIGGPKLLPKISPNKTWAGLFGGALLAAAAAGMAAGYLELGEPFYLALAGTLLALWGQAGDLVESFIKRSFSAKDSGYLIPGHGGLLDRIDGLLFVAPALALALEFMN
ncbi:MAG: phosphatidate cytidylyltransferase [Alphaproteobacteria bacterium]|nr:MAG: phosphatidate cytidylyltransferase [Alphaproteobacteria bacterium]